MGIKILTTYETVTPESAEFGDCSDRGWIDETGTEYGFRELVDLLEGAEISASQLSLATWATHYDADFDYETAETTSYSYHPVTERDLRYFRKAWQYANQQRAA